MLFFKNIIIFKLSIIKLPLNRNLLFHVIQYQQLKLVMDSIIWAFRHTERNIAETGLNLLVEMLKNFQVHFPPAFLFYQYHAVWDALFTLLCNLTGFRVL
jgi:hypothetical protein